MSKAEEWTMPPRNRLPFESDIYELEDLLERLEAGANGPLGTAIGRRRWIM
jgi:hypothetical protein